MLRLSTRSRYGLRALVNIGVKTRLGKTATACEIASEENISEKYLEQLLSFLRNQKIIAGKRGSKGGYQLKVKEDEITILEILEILEGPIEPVFCVNDEDACERADICVTRTIWKKLHQTVKSLLEEITLKDLVDEAIRNRIYEQKDKKSRKIC